MLTSAGVPRLAHAAVSAEPRRLDTLLGGLSGAPPADQTARPYAVRART